MSTRFHSFALALLGSASLFGCSDNATPATDAATTDAPATDVPATDVPATDAPATDAPATDVPATDVPATDVPATDAPATDVPATDVPATDVPATDVPARDVPATDAPATDGGLAAACTASGGTVMTSLCCQSTGDFPNTCTVGACGCAPAASHNVMTCVCPSGQCFDGTRCAPR